MRVEPLVVGPIEANCYLVYAEDSKEAAIIDPGADGRRIIAEIDRLGLSPKMVINTHGHYDHVGANDDVAGHFDIPVYIYRDDAGMLGSQQDFFGMQVHTRAADREMTDGDKIPLAGQEITVIHTPGHTRGGCVLYLEKEGIAFTGDTVFKGTVGRTDLDGGSFEEIVASVQKRLADLPDDTVLYPGHGPKTTLAFERQHNPYFRWEA
ncbi:MBL fold metallo-hydrolase [Peptococcus simiae]|uniref:MBL fold metallo-hydrolase n=1 Tax=Peptococcus simiae TaxID=1643805 RepID=A0ABW9GYW0_9FIRM